MLSLFLTVLPTACAQEGQSYPLGHQAAGETTASDSGHHQPDAPDAAATPDTATAKEDSAVRGQPLSEVYAENRRKTEQIGRSDATAKLLAAIVLMMGGLFLLGRFAFGRKGPDIPPEVSPSGEKPFEVQSSKAPFWQQILTGGAMLKPPGTPRMKILSRLRLGPNREIVLLQLAERTLVVGSTPNQFTLLTELSAVTGEDTPDEQPLSSLEPVSPGVQEPEKQIYRKYLQLSRPKPQASTASSASKPVAAEEEVTVLSDYDEHFEAF